MGVGTTSGAIPAIKSGLVRPLGITSKTRYAELPDIPTFTELGYPSIDCTMWVGVSGPPGLSADIAATWSDALREISKDAKYIEQMTRIGATIQYLGPQELRQFVVKEIEGLKRLGVKKPN
jgi:tripartite-type tricarboxylate transporter receptor subunit TctC